MPWCEGAQGAFLLLCIVATAGLLGRMTAPTLTERGVGVDVGVANNAGFATAGCSPLLATDDRPLPRPATRVSPSPLPPPASEPAHCGRTWPIRGVSTVVGSSDSWGFSPSNCGAAAWSSPGDPGAARSAAMTALTTCLANRRVFVWGNSVSRGFAFELPTLIDGAPTVSREEQKELCEKLGEQTNERCTNFVGSNTTVSFRWINFMDIRPFQPAPSRPPLPEFLGPMEPMPDSCGNVEPRICFGRALRNATDNDVLLVNMGYSYGLMDPNSIPARELGDWRRSHVRAFIANVRAVFSGTVVYMNTPPFFASGSSGAWNNARLVLWSEIVMPLFLAESDWLVFDMWSVASDFVGTNLYADAVHMPGRLTQIGWAFLQQMLCPS